MTAESNNAYQASARKWRPQRFEDVVGQEGTTRTLQNAIKAGRIHHAYLFTGPRGVGKTTIARIFAKALNCASVDAPTPEPCGTCTPCKEIAAGISPDVIEIDGASNRGIDDIRELRERVRYAPTSCRFKVYYIDEVHMLTTEAFNALLKTLEEPPPHVKFLFATTEPHKVIATITSRCLRFDLRRIPTATIAERLQAMAEAEGIAAEPGALSLVARCGEGSMRDAQSIFDQVVAFAGKTVGVKEVTEILGLVGGEVFWDLDRAVIDGHVEAAITIADRVVDEGRDVRRFIEELIAHYRDLLVALSSQHPEKVLDLPQDAMQKVIELAPRFNRDQLLHIIELLAAAEEQLRYAMSPQVTLEVALIKLVRSRDRVSLESIVERIETLRALGPGTFTGSQVREEPQRDLFSGGKKKPSAPHPIRTGPGSAERPLPSRDQPPQPAANAQAKATGPMVLEPLSREEASEFGALWGRVLQAIEGRGARLEASIASGRIVSFNDGELVIGFDENDVFHYEQVAKRETRGLIEDSLAQTLGTPVRVTITRVNNDVAQAPGSVPSRPRLTDDPLVKKSIELFGGKLMHPGR
ncbi:MAG: DNA polymerase III subunit gamma/tau [Verrucomicrobia bacterium]|nr:DNA polymerase III subunit gamma/tau [Verrucomicrobiota bacterium]